MRQSPCCRQAQTRRGATVVEFALTAPLLFMLLMASLELGHANMVFHATEAACYEGARTGIIPGSTAEECIAAAQQVLDISKIRAATIRVTPADLRVGSDSIVVSIEVPYQQNTIVTPAFTKGLTIQRRCELLREK